MKTNNPITAERIFIAIITMIVCYVVAFTALTRSITDARPMHSNVVYHAAGATYNLPVYSADSLLLKGVPSAAAGGLEIKGGLFNRNPVFLVWAQLILIMISIAAGAGLVFFWQARSLAKTHTLKPGSVTFSIMLALGLCIALGVIPTTSDLLYSPDKVVKEFGILFSNSVPPIIVYVTLALILPIIVVIFMLVPAAETIAIKEEKTAIEEAATQLESLNKQLISALQTLAVIVVFSVLTSGALRETIKATIFIPHFDIFPKQESYVYGLYFSSFLGIIYVPVHLFLKQKGDVLKEKLAGLKKKATAPDEKWLKEMDGLVTSKNSPLDTLKLTFTVLSPLITSFLPELLKLK